MDAAEAVPGYGAVSAGDIHNCIAADISTGCVESLDIFFCICTLKLREHSDKSLSVILTCTDGIKAYISACKSSGIDASQEVVGSEACAYSSAVCD